MEPNVISVNEAAAELGVTPSRVRVLIRSGRLKAARLGQRAWLIHPKDMDAVRERKPGWKKGRKRGPKKPNKEPNE